MKITNKHNLPEVLVNYANNDEYYAGPSDISVTRLIDSPQIAQLTKKHADEMETDVHDLIPSLMGKALHSLFEKFASKNHVSEKRYYATVNGWKVSGQIDNVIIEEDGVIIEDYKSTSVWAIMAGKAEWERQLNCYAYLWNYNHVGMKVKELRVVALARDWKKRDTVKAGYPQTQMVVIPLKLWSDEDQANYMRERVHLHAQAEADHVLDMRLPKCDDDEKWSRDATYAVIKPGSARASRVFATAEEAMEFSATKPGTMVEVRPPVAVRCQEYCRVNHWCKQYAEELEDNHEVQ